KPTAEPTAAIIKPDRDVQFSRVSVIEHLMLKDYLFLLLLLIVIPHAKKEPKNTFVFVENKMHLLSIFIPLTNKQK
ncbi:hypothetical protein ACN2MX_004259, partial [Acinetobacter baumannii]